MIVDTSAIVAVIFEEPGYEDLLARLAAAAEPGVGAPTLVEASVVLSARLGRDAQPLLARFTAAAGITIVPFGEAHFVAAAEAWLRYGRGRHPARLNLGDCLTYATAKLAGQPLLCVGDDFTRTDLAIG